MRQKSLKKTVLCFAVFITCLISSGSQAQDWSAILTIDPYPSPYLNDWQIDPTLANLEIQNNSQEQDVVIVDLEVTNGSSQLMLRASSRHLLVPPGQPVLMNSMDYQNWNVSLIDQNLQDKATRTGMFPEGDYEACITIRNLWGTELVSQVCAYLTIAHPEPPELIYPIDYEMVYTSYPVFQWIPPHIQSANPMVFIFRLVEVMEGQIPERALEANYPHYENYNVFQSDLEYPLDALALEADKTYAWQIQAVNLEGRPATKNDGKSIIGIFTTPASFEGELPVLQLMAPDNNTLLSSIHPTFEWFEPLVTIDGFIYYTINITEMISGQTPEQATASNTPHFVNAATITQTAFEYPVFAPALETGKNYAWQVRALDQYGHPVTSDEGKSEVRSFTAMGESQVLDETILLPEKLPLPSEEIAYLLLKMGENPLVNYSFSPDSSEITVSSLSPGTTPLKFPCLQGDMFDPPQVGATVNVTFNRYTLDILNSDITASPRLDIESPFNLSRLGVPIAIQNIQYQPGIGEFSFSAVPSLFNTLFRSSPINLILSSSGIISGAVPEQLVSENIPLVKATKSLVYSVQSIQGEIWTSLLSDIHQTNLDVSGSLVFLPYQINPQERSISLHLNITAENTQITSYGSIPEPEGITIPTGPVSLNLHNFTCNTFTWSPDYKTWNFDFAFDINLSLTDLYPTLNLPQISSVHLTTKGFGFPQVSIPDLSLDQFFGYQDIQMKPYAFRMDAHTFDWCAWSGKEIGDWGFRFDLKIKFVNLSSRLSELVNEMNRNPLTVLNAAYINGYFQGNIEPRTYATPILAPFKKGSDHGLLIEKIEGEFKEDQGLPVIDLSVLADCILPSTQSDGKQTVDLGDYALLMSTRGIFTGHSPAFTLPHPIPWSQLQIGIQSSELVLSQDENEQTALLDLDGTIQIPVNHTSSVTATGSGSFDLIAEQIINGQFYISDPFTIDVPAFTSTPALKLQCLQGAVVNPSGLQIKDGSGELLVPGTPVPLRYIDNVTFNLPDLQLLSGTIEFDNSFAFQISNLSSNTETMQWKAVGAGTLPLTTLNNLILPLHSSVNIKNGILTAQGNTNASVFLNNKEFTNLDARFSTDFSVIFHSVRVGSGRVDFYANNNQVAYLDSTGFWPGEFFIVDSLFTILPLPDSTIAYIKLQDQQGNSLISTEQAGENIRLFTRNGEKVDLYLPALSFNSGNIPVVQTLLDVVVNPSTLRLVSGSVSLTASSGGELVSLAASGVPLKVTSLQYDDAGENFKMYADLQPILPKALQGANLTGNRIALTADGFETFDTGYSPSYKEGSPAASVDIGEYLKVTLDGMRVNVASDPDSVVFSGNIFVDLFTSQNSTTPLAIHYYADLNTDSARFYFDKSYAINRALPLGCGNFQVITNNGTLLMEVSAPLDENTFDFKILQGILSLNTLCNGFNLTIEDFTINQDGISIPDVNLSQGNEQILTLFGTDITINGISFNVKSPQLLEMLFNGSITLFGKDINFSELTVATDCSIGNTKLSMNPVDLVDGSLSLDSLRIQNNILKVHGNFTAIDPFNTISNIYTIHLCADGSWADNKGNILSEKKITVVSQENPQDPGVSLGMEPMDVLCKLAKVDIEFNGSSNKDAAGNIGIEINSYWPSLSETETMIPIIGSFSFPNTDGSQNSWIIDKNTVSVITLADLLNFEIKNINVLDESEFTISMGGEFSLILPNLGEDQGGGGGEFRDFHLTEGTFEFGEVLNADFDISGVNIQLSRFAFGFDLSNFATYDINLNKNNASAEPVTVSHKGFYLIFGGSMSSELLGFDGGIDSLLIYKSSDQFYLLIKNAHFVYGDMIDGALDLILDIDLNEVDFQFLIGGHLDVSEKGFAVVGEISYKETTFSGQTFMCPGFGLFLAAKTGLDIRLTPLPITIEGLGLGIFFNPDPLIEEWVRSHLGFENGTEDQYFFDAYNEYRNQFTDIMTFLEIYAYVNISVPEKAVLEAQALLTLATDKLRLDMKVTVIGNEQFQKYCKLGGSGFLEVRVPQDFSNWPYAAGNITVEMTAKDQTGVKVINMPSPGEATSQLEFFVIDKENWALHGAICAEVARSLEADFEFFIGPPGFLVRAGIAKYFDAVVVEVEIGMEVSVWFLWEEPQEWGGYARAWVQATCLSEAFAGVRGELGAALVGKPDFYIYGYAELTAWFLDISWTKCIWVEWRDGEIDGGTGGDSRMMEIIAQASEVSDKIMGQVDEIQYQILQTKRDAFTQLSPQDIKNIINTLKSGHGSFYWYDLNEDTDAVIDGLNYYIKFLKDASYENQCKSIFVDYKDEVISAFHPDTLGVLNGALNNYSDAVDGLNTVLSSKVDDYQEKYDSLKTQIQNSSFTLDTLIAFSDIPDSPIENPLNMSIMDFEGKVVPNFSVDTTRANSNQKNAAALQQSFDAWLNEVLEKLNAIETLRSQLYNGFGPGSSISKTQGAFIASLLEKNTLDKSLLDKVSNFCEFYLARKQNCETLYYQNINKFNNIFKYSRWDPATGQDKQSFIDEAIERRYGALKSLAGGDISIDTSIFEDWEASEELAIIFYTTVPFIFYDFTINKMDSLYNSMVPAYNQAFHARNDIHRDFTGQTDVIWNKYAELSENLYNLYDALIDEVKTYEKIYGVSAPISAEQIKNRMETLGDEFLLSALSSFSANRTDSKKRYAPITVGFDWSKNQDIAEYAFSISEGGTNQFQSVGDRNQFGLDFFLPISFYLIQKQYEVRTRVRNKAGYAVAGQVVDLSLQKSHTKSTSVINEVTPPISSALVVDFPENYASSGIDYFKNSETQIHVDWEVTSSSGPSPFAEFRYQVYSQDSPDNPVVNWTSTGTLSEVTIRDLNLDANTTSPYIVQIAGYDAEGNVRKTKESPSLYIDHTPPHFPDDIQMEFITRSYGENRVVFQCRQARDWFSDENSKPDLYARIDTLAAYQYKLFYAAKNPDSLSWQTIDTYPLPNCDHTTYKESDLIHIDLGLRPLKADMKLALRARNLHAANNNGFGEVKIVNIPQQEDKTPPTSPSFKIAGQDENGNIIFNMVTLAEDQESGVAGYNYTLMVCFEDQKIVRAFPQNSLQVDFPADSVYPGKRLVIPINHDSVDVRAMWLQVGLAGINASGVRGPYESDFICFPPTKPILNASLEQVSIPGTDTYTILKFEMSTDPHPADFTVDMRFGTTINGSEIVSAGYLFGPSYGHTLKNSIRLPDSLTFGSPVHITARSVSRILRNRREKSDSVVVSLMTPDPPMFTSVTQNQEGYLVLLISSPAFNGRKTASYQFEIQSFFKDNQNIIRPFPIDPLQADFSNEDVQQGVQLILPVYAKDAAPMILVKLKARSADGDVDVDEAMFNPKPPLPEVIGRITRHELMKEYQLELQGNFDDPIMQGNSHIGFAVGSGKGKHDITGQFLTSGVSYGKKGYNIFVLPDKVSEYTELYLSARNVTGCDKKSVSYDTVLSIPPPLMFDHVKKNDSDYLMAHMLNSGFTPDVTVAGYQFGVFRNDDKKTPIRSFPAGISDFDFTPQDVVMGEYLELPVHVTDLPLRKLVLVAIKAISTTGESVTFELGYMPYPPVPVEAFITRNGNDNILNFQGTFDDIYLFGGQLTIFFTLGTAKNADDILKAQFEIGVSGEYNATFSLAENIEVGQFYYLSSWYVKENEKSGVYRQQLTTPCEPMFREVKQPDEESLVLPIISTGFNDSPNLVGYQYALGSASGQYDIRPFPDGTESVDFNPDQVQKNQDLIIQQPTLGLPEACFVALKAINLNGVTNICEQSFQPIPSTPVIRLLNLQQIPDGKTNILRFEVDNNSIDSKTANLVMSAYYGSRNSIIVTADAIYSYPTWDWSIYYTANQSNPVFECHFTKLMPTAWDYYVEIKSMDRYREKESGIYKLKFNIDMDLNILNIEVIESE